MHIRPSRRQRKWNTNRCRPVISAALSVSYSVCAQNAMWQIRFIRCARANADECGWAESMPEWHYSIFMDIYTKTHRPNGWAQAKHVKRKNQMTFAKRQTILGRLSWRYICFATLVQRTRKRQPQTRNGYVKCAFAQHQLNTEFILSAKRNWCDVDAMHTCVMAASWTLKQSKNVNCGCEKRKKPPSTTTERPTERTSSVAATDEHVNRECVSKCNYCWIIETCARRSFATRFHAHTHTYTA